MSEREAAMRMALLDEQGAGPTRAFMVWFDRHIWHGLWGYAEDIPVNWDQARVSWLAWRGAIDWTLAVQAAAMNRLEDGPDGLAR